MIYKTQNIQGSVVIIRQDENGNTTSFGEWNDNTDYQAYLKHIAEGGEVLPADNEQTD